MIRIKACVFFFGDSFPFEAGKGEHFSQNLKIF